MMDIRSSLSMSPSFRLAGGDGLNKRSPQVTPPSIDFGRAMSLVKRRLRFVLACVGLGAALAIYTSLTLLPNYTARALIRVNETEVLDPMRAEAAVDIQLTMLQSPAFLARVYEVAHRDAKIGKEVVRLADLERRLHVMQEMRSPLVSVTYTARSPEVAAAVANLVVRTHLDDLSVQAAQGIDRTVADLEQHIAALKADLDRATQDAARDGSPTHASDSAGDLKQQVEEMTVNLALARRIEEKRREAFAMSPPARLVAPAETPQRPSSVKPILIVIPAIAASGIFGVALALFLGRIDPRIYDESDLAFEGDAPCVGAVPPRVRWGRLSSFADCEGERLGYTRAIDAIAASVLLLPRARPHTLLITSSVGDDGKATFVAGLGSAAARLGLRVLVIDLGGVSRQERWPHRREPDHRLGVVDVLSERCAPGEAIERLPGSQVDCLPAGPASSDDALALIASGRLKVVVKELSLDYDCIILTAPPVVGSSCTLLAAALADAALLIARSGQSTYAEVVRGLDLLASSLGVSRVLAKSLAMVLTDAPARSLPAPYRDKRPIKPALQSLHLSRPITMEGRPVGDTLLRSTASGHCDLAKQGDAS
jgi:Mrp family chromosome partitioning ATPase